MRLLTSETVIRIRPELVPDPMSGKGTLADWANAQEVAISGVLFTPGTSSEFPNVELEALSALATLHCPLGTDITPNDRIRARGALWSVEGRRQDWRGRLAKGCVVTIKFIREEET